MIQVKDKSFEISIPEDKIQHEIKRVAHQIEADFTGKNPLFLPVLNGSFIFAADLLREIHIPCEVSFIKLASYQGLQTSGQVNEIIGLNRDLTDRHVVIVEDIIDSGFTMAHLLDTLHRHNPASISVCTLLTKPDALRVVVPIDYVCLEAPNIFLLGYGLDYDGYGRNMRDIYTLVK